MKKKRLAWIETIQRESRINIVFQCSIISEVFMRRTLINGGLALILALSLHAGEPDSIRLIREAGTSGDFPGFAYMVVLDHTKVQVMDTGLSHVNQTLLYKVLTPAGASELKVMTFGYDPQSAYVDIRSARVIHADGKTTDLDVSLIRDYPAPARAIYWGAREKMLTVGRLLPGEGLEIKYYRKGFTYALLHQEDPGDHDARYIPPMKGHFYDIVPFYASHPIQRKCYEVTLPGKKRLQFEFYNGNARHFSRVEGENVHYLWEVKDIRPIKREPGQVSMSDVAPKLLLSTSPDWKAKSLWFHGVNEDFGSFETNDEITKKVNEIVAGISDPWEKISRLTHWVAEEIRYSGISMGDGEGFTLHPGSMTFLDRCGVCKDKAGMLVTMLRAAGFTSYPAMTMAGSRIDRIPADQFNHSVTVVKMDGKYHLLDPTWVPGVRELWSSAEQQQEYLMGIPEGADLMSTPISPPEKHYLHYAIDSRIDEKGGLIATVKITAEGQSDSRLRRYLGSGFIHESSAFKKMMLGRQDPRIRITGIEHTDTGDLSSPMEVTFRLHVPEALIRGKRYSFLSPLSSRLPLSDAMVFNRLRTQVKKRDFPFRTRCSQRVRVTETIRLPGRMQMVFKPQFQVVSGSGADFKGKISSQGNRVTIFKEIRLKKRIYQPEDWPGVRDSVLEFKKPEGAKLIFRNGGAR